MYALLGDFHGTVNVPNTSNYVYYRANKYRGVWGFYVMPRMEVGIAKCEHIPPVYGLLVKIVNGEVIAISPMKAGNDEQ